jgi:hypothetical protein
VKVTRYVKFREYVHLAKLARKYLKAHPPDQPILDSMTRFLQPPDPIPRGSRIRGRRERAALREEMSRWSDKRFQKRYTCGRVKGDRGYLKHDYSPRGVLAVLIGITAYIDEREGQGFPHESEAIEKAHALIRLWKRPRYTIGRKQPVKVSARITASVLRGLAARLREFTAVNTFCLVTARAILAEYKAAEAARIKALPKTYTQTELRIMAERRQKAAAAKLHEEQRAAFLLETEPPDPGPRPPREEYITVDYKTRVEAWAVAHTRFITYQQRRQLYGSA